MKNKFALGQSSSIEGATVGAVIREGKSSGHEIFSYRERLMGVETGEGCVLFPSSSEMEELYKHMDWMKATPYRELSILQQSAGESTA